MVFPRTFFILFLSVMLLGVAGVVAFRGYEKYRENQHIAQEVLKLQEEASRLQSETEQLSDRIAYLRTPEYTEREMKEKLNVKKPEESVAIVESKNVQTKGDKMEKTPQQREEIGQKGKSINNSLKWWNFFFSINGSL